MPDLVDAAVMSGRVAGVLASKMTLDQRREAAHELRRQAASDESADYEREFLQRSADALLVDEQP